MSRGLVFILLCACLALELSAVAIGRTLIRGLAFQAKHRALPGSRRALDTSLGYANAESQSDSVDNVPKVDLAAWIGRVNHGVNQDLVSTDREAQLRVLSSYEAIMDKNRKRNGTMDDIQSIELLRSRKAGRRRRWQVSKINKIYPLVDPDDVLLGLAPPSADELVDLANSKDFVPRNPRLGPCKFLTPGVVTSSADPDFTAMFGKHKNIRKCRRSVGKKGKHIAAKLYGIREEDWSDYEFDHMIPLGLGGSNHPSNIWPQHRNDTAHMEKSLLAHTLHRGLEDGLITQKQAILVIFAYLNRAYGLRGNERYS
ncbi:MAG: hypothetical protein SGCHY_003820 [Lobulomycetales sp.]